MPVNPEDYPGFPPEIIEEMRRAEAKGLAKFSKSYKVTRVMQHSTAPFAHEAGHDASPGSVPGEGTLRIEIETNGHVEVYEGLDAVPEHERARLDRFMARLGPGGQPQASPEIAHEEAPLAPDLHLDAATSAALVTLVRAGRKIDAIKLLRERTGLGLAEAKRAIDAMELSLTGKKPSGCLGLLLLPLAVGALFLIP